MLKVFSLRPFSQGITDIKPSYIYTFQTKTSFVASFVITSQYLPWLLINPIFITHILIRVFKLESTTIKLYALS